MAISKKNFGILPDGRAATLFTLDGGDGVVAAITDFGGVITSLRTVDRKGAPGEIGLGYETLDKYIAKPGFYGALVGRVGNRIKAGKFVLDGKEYQLDASRNGNHLHGGKEGFNRKLWNAETDGDTLVLRYTSPDGEENYPGTLSTIVRYSVIGRELKLDYTATTDKPTIVNLTNHEFFNLNCCAGDIFAHELMIKADRYTPVDEKQIPTGEIAKVEGTPFDFRAAKPIGRDMGKVPGGFDHNYVFTDADRGLDKTQAAVFEPTTGRTMEVSTNQPCIQFYAGNNLDGSVVGIGGIAHKKHYALCLETQLHPDAINHPNFASPILRPGETYRHTTIYRFGTR